MTHTYKLRHTKEEVSINSKYISHIINSDVSTTVVMTNGHKLVLDKLDDSEVSKLYYNAKRNTVQVYGDVGTYKGNPNY